MAIGEAGSITTNSPTENQPITVNLATPLTDPVFALSATNNGGDRFVLRITGQTLDANGDPQAPWQKGTVENTNCGLRMYLPRSTEPTALTNRYLRSIATASIQRRANAWVIGRLRKYSKASFWPFEPG